MGRASAAKKLKIVPKSTEPIKLDFGCGPHKREGFQGVDQTAFAGVDYLCDLTQRDWRFDVGRSDATKPAVGLWNDETEPELGWTLPDNSVAEAHASHFVEHLTAIQRVAFCNELYRVLVPGGACQIIVPHWNSCRAYGDFTHQWPPVSEFWFSYLNRDWRLANAPHDDASVHPQGYSCNFDWSYGYSLRQDVVMRNQEYQQFAMGNYKEVCQDIIATIRAIKG